MRPTQPRLVVLLLPALLLMGASTLVHAQRPNWVPVAQLVVGSIGQADPAQMSLAMNRCTALNMTLSGLLAQDSPDLSRGYQDEALKLIQSGILIEMNNTKLVSGIEPDISMLSDSAIAAVRGLITGYTSWLNENYSVNGSYFNDEFEIELKGCEFASRFVHQMLEI